MGKERAAGACRLLRTNGAPAKPFGLSSERSRSHAVPIHRCGGTVFSAIAPSFWCVRLRRLKIGRPPGWVWPP